jgi:hypothetical protein
MWGLFGYLLAKGQIAWINRYPQGEDIIAIYPEIQNGNPYNAKTVVRYILAKPGEMGSGVPGTDSFRPGPTTFEPSDRLYYFSRMFGKAPCDHYLFLPIANLHIFKDQHKKRTKNCYLIGKGTNKLVHPKGSIELTRDFSHDQALADLLNECHVLYCYDKLSAMMEIARLCGCRVKYYGSYDEYELRKYEPGLNGVGFMGDDVQLDTELFREHYIEMIHTFSSRLDAFIDATQHD